MDIARYSFPSWKLRILAIVRRELRRELYALDDVVACESFEFLAFTFVERCQQQIAWMPDCASDLAVAGSLLAFQTDR